MTWKQVNEAFAVRNIEYESKKYTEFTVLRLSLRKSVKLGQGKWAAIAKEKIPSL